MKKKNENSSLYVVSNRIILHVINFQRRRGSIIWKGTLFHKTEYRRADSQKIIWAMLCQTFFCSKGYAISCSHPNLHLIINVFIKFFSWVSKMKFLAVEHHDIYTFAVVSPSSSVFLPFRCYFDLVFKMFF